MSARTPRRPRRRYPLRVLTDLTRGDVDPGWARTLRAVEALRDDLEPCTVLELRPRGNRADGPEDAA